MDGAALGVAGLPACPAHGKHATDQRLTERAAKLGFASLHAYLADRVAQQAWPLTQVADELGMDRIRSGTRLDLWGTETPIRALTRDSIHPPMLFLFSGTAGGSPCPSLLPPTTTVLIAACLPVPQLRYIPDVVSALPMRMVSPNRQCADNADALMRACLPEWRGSRHPERMGNTPSTTDTSSSGPRRWLCGHRPRAAAPARPRRRPGLRRPCRLPHRALPTAGQPRTAGRRAWYHHRGCPPPARPRRPDPTTPPGHLCPPAPRHHRSAAGRPGGRARLCVAGAYLADRLGCCGNRAAGSAMGRDRNVPWRASRRKRPEHHRGAGT
jgi:hypothetical protein